MFNCAGSNDQISHADFRRQCTCCPCTNEQIKPGMIEQVLRLNPKLGFAMPAASKSDVKSREVMYVQFANSIFMRLQPKCDETVVEVIIFFLQRGNDKNVL